MLEHFKRRVIKRRLLLLTNFILLLLYQASQMKHNNTNIIRTVNVIPHVQSKALKYHCRYKAAS